MRRKSYNHLKDQFLKPSIAAFYLVAAAPLLMTASDFATGKKAFDKGDYETAAREWEAAANDGDVAAQWWFGRLLEFGRGVDKDEVAGRRWQVLSAERGYEYARNALGWPIRPESTPYLTCTPEPVSPTEASIAGDKPTQADSIKGFSFRVTLHNWRPPIEAPVIPAFNFPEPRKDANIQIKVYRIENDQRLEVRNQIAYWGSGAENGKGAIEDRYETASVRIPVEESERRTYIEQFLVLLSQRLGQTPAQIQQTRQLMLQADRPNEASYIDDLMPNRLGTYEIVCRYHAQSNEFWPEALVALPLRFEYVQTMNWIEIFNQKKPAK
jgi:hypothetical protein